MDILDVLAIRLPCNVCGRSYQVPLSDVVLSHAVIHEGCPVPYESECPPLFQGRLFEDETLQRLQTAWRALEESARSSGGELIANLVFGEAEMKYPSLVQSALKETANRSSQPKSVTGRIRNPVPASMPVLKFSLAEETQRMIAEQPWQAGHTANTIVKYPDLRIILITLKTGAQLHEHRTAGRIAVQVLAGHVQMKREDEIIDLRTGHMVTLDRNLTHDIEALADSALLLTIVMPADESTVREEAEMAKSAVYAMADTVHRQQHQLDATESDDAERGVREHSGKEEGLDETLAATFPCSDPLSTLPDPDVAVA